MNTLALLLLLPVFAVALLDEPERQHPLARLGAAIPREVAGFRAVEADEKWDPQSIYEYIDGAAEVYLAYGMRACLARRFDHPDGGIVLDIFEMPDAAGAFGAFTYDQDGEPLEVGQGALLREGWLTFWQGRFFVSITAEGNTPAHREAMLALARTTATAIGEGGALPELVQRLPGEGQRPRTLRYLRHPAILATHLPLEPGDPLGLGAGSEAALVRFRDGALLLLVRYSDGGRAAAGLEAARRLLATPAPAGREGLWGAAVEGSLLALVGEAQSEARVQQLLAAALAPPQAEEEKP